MSSAFKTFFFVFPLSKYPKDFNQKYSHLRLRVKSIGTFCWGLEVRTSSSNAEGESLIPYWDLRSHMLLHPPHPYPCICQNKAKHKREAIL